MIVIAIIGILAAIAIPAYNEYLIRARVTELINLSSSAKTAVAVYRISKGTMPTSNAIVGVTSPTTKYVNSLTVGAAGVITVVGNITSLQAGSALSIILTPTFANGVVTWTCTGSGATKYIPGSCK